MDKTTNELESIVRLHEKVLFDSSLTLLGRRFVRMYYRTVASSDQDFLFVAGEDSVDGVAVLSIDSSSLMKRLFVKNFFSWDFFMAVLGSFVPLAREVAGEFGSVGLPASLKGKPEVVQIFTDPSKQGQGVGTALLEQVEIFLKQVGVREYFVKTAAAPSNKALDFYRKKGFKQVAVQQMNGKDVAFFNKSSYPQ